MMTTTGSRDLVHSFSRALGIACLALGLARPAVADLLYYLPFDDGANPTLANFGTVGGTATAVTIYAKTPSASNDVHAALGGAYSEYFPMGGSAPNAYGGRIDLPDSTDQLNLNTAGDELTISAWIKWNGPDTHPDLRQGIVSNLTGTANQGWAFSVRNDGSLDFSGATWGNRNTTATITPNAWTHVAMTWRTLGGWATSLAFYINGQPYGTYNGATPMGVDALIVNSDQTIRLGNVDGTNLPVNGRLDDVALWDTRLSASEIAALVNLANGLGFDAGMADDIFGLYEAAGAGDGAIGGTSWHGWYDSGPAQGALGTITYLGRLDSWNGYDYPLASSAHYYYVNLGSGVVIAIPEPASLALLALLAVSLSNRAGWVAARRR